MDSNEARKDLGETTKAVVEEADGVQVEDNASEAAASVDGDRVEDRTTEINRSEDSDGNVEETVSEHAVKRVDDNGNV